jgi:hypothetical protein
MQAAIVFEAVVGMINAPRVDASVAELKGTLGVPFQRSDTLTSFLVCSVASLHGFSQYKG